MSAITYPQAFAMAGAIAHSITTQQPYRGGGGSPTPPPPPPDGTPTTLVATTFDDDQIDLTWVDVATNATSFEIERSLTSGSGFSVVGSVAPAVQAFSDTGLDPSTQYFYRVFALNSGGASPPSNEANDTTDGPAVPDAPTLLVATAISSTEIDLVWQDNSDDEDSFQIERSLVGGGTGFANVGSTVANDNTFSDTGLDPNTQYFYRVFARSVAGDSLFSNEDDDTTDDVVPLAPSLLVATTVSSTAIDLAWQDNSDNEVTFQIERSLVGGGTGFANVGNVAADVEVFSDTALDPSTQYFYRVFARNAIGDSGFSNEDDATTDATTAPVIDLDMFGVAAPAGTTWTCASIKRYWDEQGLIRSAAVDEWFTEHDWETLEPLGPWTEGPSSNEIIESWDLLTDWSTQGGALTITNAAVADGPDLTADYSLLRGLSGNGVGSVSSTLGAGTFTNDARIEPSLIVRRVSTSGDVAIQNRQGNSLGNWLLDLALLGDGWEWITRDHPAITLATEYVASAAGLAGINIFAQAGAPLDFDIAYVQQEEGEVSTSPMKTNGAAFDRVQSLFEADSLVNLVNQTEGTIVFYGRTNDIVNVAYFMQLDDGAESDRIRLSMEGPPQPRFASANSGGDNAVSAVSVNLIVDTNFGLAATYITDDAICSADGTSSPQDISCDFPLSSAFTDFHLGKRHGGTNLMFGTMSKVQIFDFQETDLNREALSINPGRAATKPLAPTALNAVAISATEIDLDWKNITLNETGYRLERSLDGATGWATVTTTAPDVVLFSDTGLTTATQYFYRVIAESALGDSAASNIAEDTTS